MTLRSHLTLIIYFMVDKAESDRLRDRKIAAEISFKLRFADFSVLYYTLQVLQIEKKKNKNKKQIYFARLLEC